MLILRIYSSYANIFIGLVEACFIYLSQLERIIIPMLKKTLLALLLILGFNDYSSAQFGLSSEVGIIMGPVAFQSDYGERYDFSTNVGNTGIGIGIVHYMNFSYSAGCSCYTPETFWNDHFKLRSELSYSYTKLEHFGRWVDNDNGSLGVQQLRAQYGSASVLSAGMQLEYFPLSIRDFTATVGSFAPFVSAGAHYNYFNPSAKSTLGPLGLEQTTFPKYLTPSDGKPNGFSNDPESTWSIVSSVGARYKLSPLSDLMVDLRFQYYFSNWVDGLNPNPEIYKENKANDWLVWFNVGYIYYID